MSDLIDRRKAIDAIHKEFDEICVWDESGQATANEVENILYEVPSAEPERNWIPVTEALPWNGTDVLVTVRDDSGDTPREYTSVGWRTPAGQYWIVDNEICYGVIAWMPLPEPWRGE